MFCHECGKELDEKSIYCPNCGAKCLSNHHEEIKTAAEDNAAPLNKGEIDATTATSGSQSTPKKKSRTPLYAGIGGGILAVILIIVLVITLGGNGQNSEDTAATATTESTQTGTVDYFDYFDQSAGAFIRETGLELTFQDGSNLYSGYDGNVELSTGDEGIDYFKLGVKIGDSSILGVSVGMNKDDAATVLQKNGLYEVKTENNHITYKEQNGKYTLDLGYSVNDDTINSVTYALEAEENSDEEEENSETADNSSQEASVDTGNTYNYYYYNVPYTPDRSYKYSSYDGYLWPTDRYYISTSDLANYTQDEVAAIRNEIYARHGYVFKTDKWSSYFNARSWYTPNYNYSESLLTDVERANIDTIVKYEKSMGWK